MDKNRANATVVWLLQAIKNRANATEVWLLQAIKNRANATPPTPTWRGF